MGKRAGAEFLEIVMKYTKFVIKNFKGISELSLDLTRYPNGKIFPLVGLNESGKSTILEGINFFQKDFDQDKRHSLIHKRDKGHFSGSIEVAATLDLGDEDKNIIDNFLRAHRLEIESEVKTITYSKKYKCDGGTPDNLTTTEITFEPNIKIKTPRAASYRDLDSFLLELLKEQLKSKLPKILYFPDFLFDFPEKIYLETVPNPPWDTKEQERQDIYRAIVQDILYTINKSYELNKFLTKLKNRTDDGAQESVDQIKREIEMELNKAIVDPWQAIFPNSPSKTIEVTTDSDTVSGYYLQIRIKEGTSKFGINERSLGFKWFFGFLFSTKFRNARQDEFGECLFLFDEPANNLHQSSQQKLLSLFEDIVSKAKIIYSTHSHYLLTHKLILNTFIVKDEGRTNEDEYNYRQNIKAEPYALFVKNYPDQETHFKPILDVLEFVDNPFTPSGNIVFFEGKFDYYTFKLVEKKFFLGESYNFNFYPGGGVEKYENIFREYLANNRKFVAVFDADKAGKGTRTDYIKDISQELEKNIFTLKDVDGTFDTYTTENLFTGIERLEIQQKTFPASTEYKKSEFNTAIQELFINENDFELSDDTKARFKKIFDFIEQKFVELK